MYGNWLCRIRVRTRLSGLRGRASARPRVAAAARDLAGVQEPPRQRRAFRVTGEMHAVCLRLVTLPAAAHPLRWVTPGEDVMLRHLGDLVVR